MESYGSSPAGPDTGDGALGGVIAKSGNEFYWALGFGILYALLWMEV